MRPRKPSVVLSFYTTTDAMATERRCMEQGIPGRLIPIPPEITAGCGLAWKMSAEEYQQWAAPVQNLGVRFQSVTEMLLC